MTALELIQAKLISSSLTFTKYFFKVRFNRKFVVNHHHEIICEALDRVIDGTTKRLIINIAPRFGKTELAVKNFIAKGFASNPASKFIHLSYSQTLALDNSEEARDFIQEAEYQELFPYVKLNPSSKAKNKWYTTEGGGVYATATGGQITGFGAGEMDEDDAIDEFTPDSNVKFSGAIIIDDSIKPDDAESDLTRNRVNQRFETTIRSRTNSRNTPIIIIGQRLHKNDLAGYLIEKEPDEWEVINLPAIQEDGTALWPFKLTLEELMKLKEIDERVFETQYQQNPTTEEGILVPLSKLNLTDPETVTPEIISFSFAVGDPANTGGDNFSMMFIDVIQFEGKIQFYVKDVIYSKDGIEALTDPILLKLAEHTIEKTFLEVNGVGLAAFLLLKAKIQSYTELKAFNTNENKEQKILSNYEFIVKFFTFRSDYKEFPQYKKFISDLTEYKKEGDNKHKMDAIDNASMASKIMKIKYKNVIYG